MRATAKALDAAPAKMHWTTKIGVAAVILFMLVVAGLNAVGWINTLPGPGGIAASVVAVSFELMALVAFEHLVAYRKAGDHGRFFLAFVGLVLAVSMNVEGGHRGLNYIATPFHAQAEAERRLSQEALDATRREVEAQINTLQARIDEVAATNPGTATYSERMAEWRANFELVTADDRRQVTALRARLDQLPLTVTMREPYPAWAPYIIASIFAFFSVFGLTMFSVKVPGPELSMGAKRAKKLAKALNKQAPAAKERDASGQFTPVEKAPPVTEEQIRAAIAALTASGEVISLKAVAQQLSVPVSRLSKHPAKSLVLDKQAWQQVTRQMAA